MPTHQSKPYSAQHEAWLLSALGERVLAKVLGIKWTPGGDRGEHEPVADYEVRTRPHPDDDLIIRANDSDDAIFALVVRLSEREFNVVGTIRGFDAKREEW